MKRRTPFSVRLSDEVRDRLKECSERTGLPEAALAQMAISAAVAAAEKADYKLVVPIEFEVKHVAVSNPTRPAVYPPHRDETALMEERPAKPKRAA